MTDQVQFVSGIDSFWKMVEELTGTKRPEVGELKHCSECGITHFEDSSKCIKCMEESE